MIKKSSKQSVKKKILAVFVMALMTTPSVAGIEVHDFDNAEQEARYQALIGEFRCPTCQNQNLAGSDAPIAQDLKQKTYEMIKDGRSDSEIRTFMVERYGDFISYKPPVRPSTWILWFFPPIMLIAALLSWVYHKQKKHTPTSPTPTAKPLSTDEENRLKQLLDNYDKKDTP